MVVGSSSSSSPLMFFGTLGVDQMNPMMNSRQESNFMSLTSAQLHHHLVAPIDQSMTHRVPPYQETEVAIAVSPNTLLADGNRYICDICYKGFPRQQNLKLHGRIHNLPFKLRTKGVVQRRVYLCPIPTCVHHNRSRALGDFGGLKKHYLRKHSNDKKHECNNCTKKYAVESDLKAHLKICGKKKYNCSCGAPFSRRSHFAFHQAFCDEQEQEQDQEDAAKHPPTSNMGGNNSVGSSTASNNNNNNNHLIGSNTLDQPTLDMGDNNNNISDSAFYTNLMMNNNNPYYNNIDLNNIIFMEEGGNIYGTEETRANSFSAAHNATLSQQVATRQLFLNDDLVGFTSSRNNNVNSIMVQGGISSSSSSGVGGFIVPQEYNDRGSNYFDNIIGYNGIPNEVKNSVNGNVVGSSFFNKGVTNIGGSYNNMQGGYYGFGDGNNQHDY